MMLCIARARNSMVRVARRHSSNIALLGVCEDRNGSYCAGPAKAPDAIRLALKCDASNSWSEMGIEVAPYLQDYGNVFPESSTLSSIFDATHPVLESIHGDKRIPFIFGGDHSITSAVTRSISSLRDEKFFIIHFDAHPDAYENFENNPHSHASPFCRILEAGNICSGLLSIGIRTMNAVQQNTINKYGVNILQARDHPVDINKMKEYYASVIPPQASIYVSIDIDVLDPAFAPGVSHREPGGLSTRQLINAIQAIPGSIIGADLMEYNPDRDVDGMTATVAAKIVKEMTGRMLMR